MPTLNVIANVIILADMKNGMKLILRKHAKYEYSGDRIRPLLLPGVQTTRYIPTNRL